MDSGALVSQGVRLKAMSDGTSIVYVVDDDISVREAVEALVRHAGWQPRLFASARDFLMRPRSNAPRCLVLDVSLPDLNGLDLQQQIATESTEMPIIFITGHGDVPMSVRAMKAGAAEFLTKPVKPEILLEAVRDALARSAAALGDGAQLAELRARYELLSRRERDVMALVVTGLMNKQVGGKLDISEITVKTHRGQVMRKMRATSLADLVNMAARLGLTHRG